MAWVCGHSCSQGAEVTPDEITDGERLRQKDKGDIKKNHALNGLIQCLKNIPAMFQTLGGAGDNNIPGRYGNWTDDGQRQQLRGCDHCVEQNTDSNNAKANLFLFLNLTYANLKLYTLCLSLPLYLQFESLELQAVS